MSKLKIIFILICSSLIFLSTSGKVLAAEFCNDQYHINKTLSNGAKWDMCWTHSKNQGIRYHHIFYTPKNGSRRMVLFDASIAQIHVPYDDNGARFHDVSDFGLGDDGSSNNNLVGLRSAECPGGTLSNFNGKAAVCHRIVDNGSAYRNGTSRKKSQLLKVLSLSKVGQYIYGVEWDFHDDGRIKPAIVATGALQRYSSDQSHGWFVDSGNRVGLAHMHNFYWRLDFDLDGTSENDIAQEINYASAEGKRYKTFKNFSTEVGRSVNPGTMRSWIIKDGNTTNRKGHKISYEIRLNEAGQREIGPSYEPFTSNDFFVTRSRDCELFASHNASVNNCSTNNLSEFVNGESIVNEDIVAWVAVSFYHMPRSEDAPKMDAHVSGFELIPRDWHTTNPSLDVTPPISLRLSAEKDFANSASTTVLIDVLANDTGQDIQINTLDNPRNGTSSIVNNKVQYTPDAGFIGTEVFWYTIKDRSGAIYGSTVNVEVTRALANNNGNGNGGGSGGGGSVSLLNLLSILCGLLLFKFVHFRKKSVRR